MVTEEKTKVANVGKVYGGRGLLGDLCVACSSLLVYKCVCVCVCLEMAGLELPDVEWATCLLRPKHRNFPLTAEINQNQGNLYSKMRMCVSLRVFICGRRSTFLNICFCVCMTTKFLNKRRASILCQVYRLVIHYLEKEFNPQLY